MKTKCPVCGNPLSFEEAAFGKAGRCQACGAHLHIQKDGGVTLESRQDGKSRPSRTTDKQDKAAREKPSRSMPRWADWLVAGMIALAIGVVLGMFITNPRLDQARNRAVKAEKVASSAQRQSGELAKLLKRAKEDIQSSQTGTSSAQLKADQLLQRLKAVQEQARAAETTVTQWKATAAEWKDNALLSKKKVSQLQDELSSSKKKTEGLQVDLSSSKKKAEGLQVKLSRTEREARDTKADIARLRSIVNTAVNDARRRTEAEEAAKRNAPWKNKSNWRRLRIRMSMDKVRRILGDPVSVSARKYDWEGKIISTYWYYPSILEGWVNFHNGRVDSWEEP